MFSVRNEQGMLSIPIPKTSEDKPLVDKLLKHTDDIPWLIPVTKLKKVLYNVRMMDIGSNSDVVHSNDEASVLDYYDLWQEYYLSLIHISEPTRLLSIAFCGLCV